jgi:hypothetical protein
MGKKDANGHFESFLSVFGVQLPDKERTLGLLFLGFMRVWFASQWRVGRRTFISN